MGKDPNPICIPLEPNPEGIVGSHSNSFVRLLGELQLITNAARPDRDIIYAVNRILLASYATNQNLQHAGTKHILRYLSGTRNDLGMQADTRREYLH